MERRSGADAVVGAHVVDVSHRGVVDRHERGHHDLHARVRTDAAGDDVVAGHAHHSPRQHNRARADDPQRTRRYEVWRVVSRAVPRELRRERRERACRSARPRGVRMVRHSDVDRRRRLEYPDGRRVADMERHGGRHMDFVRGVLARSGVDHSERARGHQEARGVVCAAPARRRCAAARMGHRDAAADSRTFSLSRRACSSAAYRSGSCFPRPSRPTSATGRPSA